MLIRVPTSHRCVILIAKFGSMRDSNLESYLLWYSILLISWPYVSSDSAIATILFGFPTLFITSLGITWSYLIWIYIIWSSLFQIEVWFYSINCRCFYVANFFIYIFACKYEGGRPSKQQWEETKNCYTGKPALFAIAGGLGLVITAMDIFCYLHNILVSSPSETPTPTGDSRVSLNEKRSTDVVDV